MFTIGSAATVAAVEFAIADVSDQFLDSVVREGRGLGILSSSRLSVGLATALAVNVMPVVLASCLMECPAHTVGNACEEGLVQLSNTSEQDVIYVVTLPGQEPEEIGPIRPYSDVFVEVGDGGCLAAPVGILDEDGQQLGELEAACEGTRLIWRGD